MNLSEVKIGIVGSGNVAHHLAHAFYQNDQIHLVGLFTRNKKVGQELADELHIKLYESTLALSQEANLVILCVSDDSIEKIAKDLSAFQGIIAHTSGVVSMEVLKKASRHYGSFYPLQTFTKQRELDLKTVPMLIDASDVATKQRLLELAQSISNEVQVVSDEQRRKLHVAAVIINNFSNHLFALAKDYTESLDLNFEVLKPLMKETVLKALEQNPKDIQTGPARRNDQLTIKQHLAMIENPKLKALYLWFTESIAKYYE